MKFKSELGHHGRHALFPRSEGLADSASRLPYFGQHAAWCLKLVEFRPHRCEFGGRHVPDDLTTIGSAKPQLVALLASHDLGGHEALTGEQQQVVVGQSQLR